jgi:DNA-binding MarR family transcriptional regulator
MESHRLDAELWQLLTAFRVRVVDQMQGGLASLGLDVSLPQALALNQISEAGPMTVSALQQRLRRSQATTSHLVSQLELRGLVERSDDPADARCTRIALSRDGRRLMSRLEQLRKRGFERVLGRVPKSVQRQLEAALRATLQALDEKETS